MILTNELLEQYLLLSSFDVQMDYKVETILDGFTEITVQTHPNVHANRRGEVHGGSQIAMADTCMASVCFTLGKDVSTIDMNGNYLRPVKAGDKLTVKSRVEHFGRRTIVVTSRIYNSIGKQVFSGRGTYFVLREINIANEIEEHSKR